MRKWLNNDFLNSAFSKEEQNIILNTNIHTNNNPKFETNGGNDTIDKVFLLSIEEAEKYFSSSENRKCQSSKYAKANGAYIDFNGNCYWWLRSSGIFEESAAYVFSNGTINEMGSYIQPNDDGGCDFIYCDNYDSCVRPTLWINIGI